MSGWFGGIDDVDYGAYAAAAENDVEREEEEEEDEEEDEEEESEGYRFGDITRSIFRKFSPARRERAAKKDENPLTRSALFRDLTDAQAEFEEEKQKTSRRHTAGTEASSDRAADAAVTDATSVDSSQRTRLLEGALWPDPDPDASGMFGCRVDDVTRMNATSVDRVFCARSVEDVKTVLALARAHGRRVSIRGTQHSMGGHTIAPDGYVLDMKRMSNMSYDPLTQTATVGPGALWSDLIHFLNDPYGMSPRTMQSYSSFSIGGAVSVNAHGITTDHTVAESVVRCRVVKWDGSEVVCSRKIPSESSVESHLDDSKADECSELFSLVLGGFGLFGVIVELTLNVVPNVRLDMEMIQTKVDDFARIYSAVRGAPDVDIKLARLDIKNMTDINLFVFRRLGGPGEKVVSSLPLSPRKMSLRSQLLYKWIMPSAASARYALERAAGKAIDWDDAGSERNQLMYESAEPLARMYSPLYDVDDTFILQEYFVPEKDFRIWLNRASRVFAEIRPGMLLNCTIRYVLREDTAFLRYATESAGSFAFVLYFRIHRTAADDDALAQIHHRLVSITLQLQGTFFLPYRHHYDFQELEIAYPNIREFFAFREKYDPRGVFDSIWARAYGMKYSAPFQPLLAEDSLSRISAAPPNKDFCLPIVSERRTSSYRALWASAALRQQFFDAFLTQIFNVESAQLLRTVMSRVIWDPSNEFDYDVYGDMQARLETHSGPTQTMMKVWRSIKNLRQQKDELTRQTASILARLGRLGKIQDYVCIGDNGKTVLSYREKLNIAGTVFVVHDVAQDSLEIPAVLERGTLEEVGRFCRVDYQHPTQLDVPSCCADLVTVNQGLHHLPQACLMEFLSEVRRILRPGGLFIVREHDATPQLVPLLDLAHSVFNVVTGVSLKDEKTEIRAFRSVAEWREVLHAAGFNDTLLYEMEPGDPTRDEMMCFEKLPDDDRVADIRASFDTRDSMHGKSPAALMSSTSVLFPAESISSTVDALLKQAPNALLEFVRDAVDSLIGSLERSAASLQQFTQTFSVGQQFIAQQVLAKVATPLVQMLRDFRPYLDGVKLKEGSVTLIPPELLLLARALLAKGKRGEASSNELLAISVIMDVQHAIASVSGDVSGDEASAELHGDFSSIDVAVASERPGAVAKEEVERLFDRLLLAVPDVFSEEALRRGGFSHRAQLAIRSRLGDVNLCGARMAEITLPYLDERTWQDISGPLEEIIIAPEIHPLTMDSLSSSHGPWWQAAMGLLGSPALQLASSTLVMASWVGFQPIVRMYQVAQRIRREGSRQPKDGAARGDIGVGAKARRMLGAAVTLVHTGEDSAPSPAAMEALTRCLRSAGVLRQDDDAGAEFTWYKLVEWLQVEYVQIFGSFMVHTPWYRFPFLELLLEYFRILWEEFSVVRETHGLARAALNRSFFIDLVPGIVMTAIFGQMQLLAAPLKMALGAEYSPDDVATQVEELLVTLKPSALIQWTEVDARISCNVLVPGLVKLSIPSLSEFTGVLVAMAKLPPHVRIVTISGHSSVQMRVALGSDAEAKMLSQFEGCEFKFQFRLPTDGTTEPPAICVSVAVAVPSLLDVVRACQRHKFRIDQIYDFWG